VGTRAMRRLLLITLLIGGCDGVGSGLIGIATTGGGGTGPGGGSAAILNFFAQPNTATVGQPLSTVLVGALDSLGSLDTTFTGVVTVALGSNSTGAGLGGQTTVRASRGFATFGNLTVDRAGTYTLVANASSVTSATSTPFAIIAVTP
jgi:hypothetical protein